MITIRSSRLKVEIARPGESYQGSRFDWSSFITQVMAQRFLFAQVPVQNRVSYCRLFHVGLLFV